MSQSLTWNRVTGLAKGATAGAATSWARQILRKPSRLQKKFISDSTANRPTTLESTARRYRKDRWGKDVSNHKQELPKLGQPVAEVGPSLKEIGSPNLGLHIPGASNK